MSEKPIQYTIRAVPKSVDDALRRRAEQERRSMNDVAIDALRKGLYLSTECLHTDLDHLIGSWVEDPEFDAAIEMHDQVDEELWK